jgi:hypothetical protein
MEAGSIENEAYSIGVAAHKYNPISSQPLLGVNSNWFAWKLHSDNGLHSVGPANTPGVPGFDLGSLAGIVPPVLPWKLAFKLVGAMLLLVTCSRPQSVSLRGALRSESSASGLAIASERGEIVVIPFDGEERYFHPAYPRASATFGADAQTVLWVYRGSFIAPLEYSVESVRAVRLAGGRPRASSFSPVSLNGAARRLAFRGKFAGEDARTGLQWASFDFSSGGFVDDTEGVCDWSPDGRELVYEKAGRIYIFGISASASKFLTQGRDPTWSLDGKWIAYRTLGGKAALVTVDGASANSPIGDHEPMGPIRWSPDSRYVLFSESLTGLHIPFVTAYYQLLVCSVSDGECVSVRRFGAGAGDTENFHWITNYLDFCARCMPGEPFN